MRVLAAAGGSGGHLYPALAIGEHLALSDPDLQWHVAVSRRGLEARVLRARGIPFTELAVEGWHRRQLRRNLLFLPRGVVGLWQSVRLVRRLRPQVAFGTGGFVSGPLLLAAWLLRVPFILVALDARPGVAIRMLASRADRIYVAHAGAGAFLDSRVPIEVIGTPVPRTPFLPAEEARRRLGLPVDGRLLLVTGGSQGSVALNRAVADTLEALLAIPGLTVLWQTGTGSFGEVCRMLHPTGIPVFCAGEEPPQAPPEGAPQPRVYVHPYLEQMSLAWAAADLALCRAGASTLAELMAAGVPAILVPLPTSAGGHQQANAQAIEQAGAAVVIEEEALGGSSLLERIEALLGDPNRLEEMGAAAAGMAHAGAAHQVAAGLITTARDLDPAQRRSMLAALDRGRSA